MKRTAFCIFLLLACCVTLPAQQPLEVKRVGLDELVAYMRAHVSPKTYYVPDEKEEATYTVSATGPEAFMKAAEAELADKGYSIERYGDSYFILHGSHLYASLPAGYFSNGNSITNDSELQKFLADQNTVATFANKVYEIGERTATRSGKVFLSGHVRDVASGEPLVGVSVYDEATKLYTVTDAAGFYRVQMPVGEGKLSFSGYSLEDMQLSLKVFDDGVLDVVMKEKVTTLKGAVVSADAISHHRDASMGLEKIRIDMVSKIPSAFGEADIIKAVLTLPGVKAVGEASSGFNVRGGSTDQNLILFNDGTIYNPSHMFGIFSAFNPDVINEVELYKSSIPAQFGGRISSVLDVHGREGNSNKFAGSLGIGLLTSHFHLEGPISKGRTTFILGGRTTYSNWMMNLIPEKTSNYSGGVAGFSDINASISHKINDKNSIHAYAYASRDKFSFANDTSFRYSNANFSVKWRSNFNLKNSMTLAAGYDSYSASFENAFNQRSGYIIDNGINQVFAKANFKSEIGERHDFSYGMNATYYMLNPGERSPLPQKDKDVVKDDFIWDITFPDGGASFTSFIKPEKLPKQLGVEPALYVSDSWRASDKLMLDGGLRLSTFFSLGDSRKSYINPEVRLSGKYSFKSNLTLKAGFNTLTQYIHQITNSSSISPMDTWRLSNANLKPQTGWQAATGLYWTLGGGEYDLSVETYYKKMRNTLDYKSGAVLIMNPDIESVLVPTHGRAFGAELMAKKVTGKLTGWVAYTYSRSLLKEMEDRGVETINSGNWYRAPHDKPNDLKIVANYKITHRYSVSGNLDYSTGRPVTVPIGYYYYGGGMRLAYSDRNTYRIPDYFRLDLAFNVEPGHYLRQFSHMTWTFGVYNVTGRKNAYSVFFNANGGTSISSRKLSVFACPIPYINLNLKF